MRPSINNSTPDRVASTPSSVRSCIPKSPLAMPPCPIAPQNQK